MQTDTYIYLIGRSTNGTDDFAQPIVTETKTGVLAASVPVSRSEYFNAGQIGIRPDYEFDINPAEYSGEKIVELEDGTRLDVYRIYEATPDKLEIYCNYASGLNPQPAPEPTPETEETDT